MFISHIYFSFFKLNFEKLISDNKQMLRLNTRNLLKCIKKTLEITQILRLNRL